MSAYYRPAQPIDRYGHGSSDFWLKSTFFLNCRQNCW